MERPEHVEGRPSTERPLNVTSSSVIVANRAADARGVDPWCCNTYSLAELRLGFGCPRHTVGPL